MTDPYAHLEPFTPEQKAVFLTYQKMPLEERRALIDSMEEKLETLWGQLQPLRKQIANMWGGLRSKSFGEGSDWEKMAAQLNKSSEELLSLVNEHRTLGKEHRVLIWAHLSQTYNFPEALKEKLGI